MGNKLKYLITASMLVTVLHGLPQYQSNDQSSTTSEPHIKNPPLLISSGPQNIANKDSSDAKEGIRPARDTVNREPGSQPIGKPQITNFPATVDFTKKDTVPSQENIRKTRNTNGTAGQLDARISSLPQSVDFKKEDTKPESNVQQRNQRDTDEESNENPSKLENSSSNNSGNDDSSGDAKQNSSEKSSVSNDDSSSGSNEDSKQSNESDNRKRRDLGGSSHPAGPLLQAPKSPAPPVHHEQKGSPRLLSEPHRGEKHSHDHKEDHPKKP